jgi:putative ABC transport system permease protein
MLSLTIKSIKAKKLRFVLTSVAVMLGVAFMAGTLVLTDTIRQSYDNIAGNVYKSTDAVVRSNSKVEGQGNDPTIRGTVDDRTLATVRAAKGVQAAEPQQLGVAVVVGRNGRLLDANPNRSVPIALGWQNSPKLNPMTVVAGRGPRAPNEVVIDRASARAGHYAPGDTIRVISQNGVHNYRLSGVVTYGGSDSAFGGQVVAFTSATAGRAFGTPGKYSAIQVVATPGFSQAQVVANVKAALHDDRIEVITGTAAVLEARDAAGTSLQFVDMFMMTFAIVALVVGAFVIYNTFSITVAQRTRETALLRAIGAKRKQVTRAVMIEALFTGVFASALGVAAGIGIAQGLRVVLEVFGMELPSAATVVNASAIVISMVVGIVVTVLAAYLPARKAAKVAPIEALRDVAVEPVRGSKRRAFFGVVVTATGAALIAQGLSGAGVGPVGLGALGVFVGVAMLGPVLARPFARLFGWPVEHARGMAGTLARENAARNPKRTASTASALMIGVGLVAMITVFAASARASVATSIDKAMKGEYIVATQFGMGGLNPQVAQRIDALPETAAVTEMRATNATKDGAGKQITAINPATVDQTVYMNVTHGSVEHMGLHDVAVQAGEAKDHNVHVGDTVTLRFAETGAQKMHVVAEFATKDPFGPYAISTAAFDANVTAHVDDYVVIKLAPGVSMAQGRQAIDGVLHDYPTAKLLTKEQFKGSMADQINKILNLVYVLLAMALVIAFFGIANTLALSVYERTREFGLLRAVGMGRRQVRSTVRWESVLIALLGTTLGTAIGLGFSWALVESLRDKGFNQLAIPAGQLTVIAVFAAVAAVVAAALPARRAARLDVLHAIQG